jgi:hypothetical protein
LTILCHGEDLFWSCVFGVLKTSCFWMSKIGEVFCYYFIEQVLYVLNLYHFPLDISMICMFDLLMVSQRFCMHFSFLLICFGQNVIFQKACP